MRSLHLALHFNLVETEGGVSPLFLGQWLNQKRGALVRAFTVLLLMLHSVVLTSVASASVLERGLPTSVSIVVNQNTTDLEIATDKDSYQVNYDTAEQRFSPLNIPFTVRSVSGNNVAYNLWVSQLTGQCEDIDTLALMVSLDGADVELGEKQRFAGIETPHLMAISFPLLPQSEFSRQCDGIASIIAELVI
jgi:hypothetical protein